MKMLPKLSRFALLFVLIVTRFLIYPPHQLFAISEGSVLGGSKIIPNNQVFINGIKVESPNDEIVIGTNKPSFFGYTFSNVYVGITIHSQELKANTTSDSNGYWIFTSDKNLTPGVHHLFLTYSDTLNTSTGTVLAATFKIPKILGNNTSTLVVPSPSLKKLDYFSITLLVFCTIIVLIFIYVFMRHHKLKE